MAAVRISSFFVLKKSNIFLCGRRISSFGRRFGLSLLTMVVVVVVVVAVVVVVVDVAVADVSGRSLIGR